MARKVTLENVYERLLDAFGSQCWWPGDSPWEIACGAVLTQNTNWSNVEKAIVNLKRVDALNAIAVTNMNHSDLAESIRPAGYYNLKAKRLKNLAKWWIDSDAPDGVKQLDTDVLRTELLAINGIGEETADSILLYAFEHVTFVVDAYTKRFLTRHDVVDENASYTQIKQLFETSLKAELVVFNEFHALIVQLGKRHCRPTPICEGCPLETLKRKRA